MDAMFFEHSCRDERQVVNGLAAGAMLRAPMDTKQIQVMAPEIYRLVVIGLIVLRRAFLTGIDGVAMREGI